MGIMKHANKLKGKEREEFLKEYYEARNRLKEAQKQKEPTKRPRKKKDNYNSKVVTYHINDLEG